MAGEPTPAVSEALIRVRFSALFSRSVGLTIPDRHGWIDMFEEKFFEGDHMAGFFVMSNLSLEI